MHIHDMTEAAYKNGYEAGIKRFCENVKTTLINRGFYPVIVRRALEEVEKEMIDNKNLINI